MPGHRRSERDWGPFAGKTIDVPLFLFLSSSFASFREGIYRRAGIATTVSTLPILNCSATKLIERRQLAGLECQQRRTEAPDLQAHRNRWWLTSDSSPNTAEPAGSSTLNCGTVWSERMHRLRLPVPMPLHDGHLPAQPPQGIKFGSTPAPSPPSARPSS